MNEARRTVLRAIQTALRDGRAVVPGGAGATAAETAREMPRKYRAKGNLDQRERLDLLKDRLADYHANVVGCKTGELASVISKRLEGAGVGKLVIPSDIPDEWLGTDFSVSTEVLRDHGPAALTFDQIAGADGVLTGCALAVAETGTLILNGGAAQGRRALTLLPDYHLCVVFHGQVVETIPEAVEALAEGVSTSRTPLTLVSGPSATSDIELIRVEGVHGPRRLDVILVKEE